jgi:hypothetical protein
MPTVTPRSPAVGAALGNGVSVGNASKSGNEREPKSRVSRRPATRPEIRKWDREVAFFWWLAPGGDRHSYAEVATKFGVSTAAVKQAARVEDWTIRAAEIEEKARAAAARSATKTIEARIRDDLQLIEGTKLVYARGLQSGHATVSASEMAAMIKVEMLISGAATERISGESAGARRSLEEIEKELAELPEAAVDAILVADAVVAGRVAELPAPGATTHHHPQPESSDLEPEPEPEPLVDADLVGPPDDEALAEAELAAERERLEKFAALEQAVLTGGKRGRW